MYADIDLSKPDAVPEWARREASFVASAASPANCKRCGGEGQLFCWDDLHPEIGPETYAIHCEDCCNAGPIKPSEGEAVAAWNAESSHAGPATPGLG